MGLIRCACLCLRVAAWKLAECCTRTGHAAAEAADTINNSLAEYLEHLKPVATLHGRLLAGIDHAHGKAAHHEILLAEDV